MTELKLDFQPESPFPLPGIVTLVMAILLAVAVFAWYRHLDAQVMEKEAMLERSDSQTQRRVIPAGRSSDLAQEVKSANEALRHLSVPWDGLFHAVEAAGNSSITLLAIEPEIERLQVKISGEAKDFKSLLAYVSRLQEQSVIGSVYLQNHDVQKDDPDRAVRFNLLATWQDKP